MNNCGRIYRGAIAQRRLEADFVGCLYAGFIQAMPQAADYSLYLQLAVSTEHDFNQNFTFQLQRASFRRVVGLGLVQDLYRSGGRAGFQRP